MKLLEKILKSFVYLVVDDKASLAQVTTGIKQNGSTEVLKGLMGNQGL
jgi:hypothetical protein